MRSAEGWGQRAAFCKDSDAGATTADWTAKPRSLVVRGTGFSICSEERPVPVASGVERYPPQQLPEQTEDPGFGLGRLVELSSTLQPKELPSFPSLPSLWKSLDKNFWHTLGSMGLEGDMSYLGEC